MPRRKVPKYRHFRPRNLGVVRIAGQDIYLGPYDSPESWEKYHRLVADWLARQDVSPKLPSTDGAPRLTINQVLLSYWTFAEGYYVRDGAPTSELACMKDALRPLRLLFGSTLASDFGPSSLKTIRDHMIDVQDLCRTEINKRVGRIKRFFRWAVSEELVPPGVVQGLDALSELRLGRTRARESSPVKPVPDAVVDATLPYLPPQLVAMIEIQRRTGMRPGEVVRMRPCDIDQSSDVWVYRPATHKNDWRGHARAVAMGPETQAFIQPYLDRASDQFLFSPEEAYRWRIEQRAECQVATRKTPIYPSELRAREKAKSVRRQQSDRKRAKGQRYTTTSYWKALTYAFRKAAKAGVVLTAWHPNQLRHSRATDLRRRYGIEATRVSLGHARLNASEIYAEKDLEFAIKIARETG